MANTPFLNLVKPADTDQALITDINSNSDKIDAGVSSLSDQIGTYAIEANTLANIESALVTYGATLGTNEIRKIRFNLSAASGVFLAQGYMGTIKRYGSGARYIVEVQNCDTTGDGDIIAGSYYNGTWKWQGILGSRVYYLPAGNSVTITDLPRAYMLTVFASNSASLGIYAGVGYGAEASRHKMFTLVQNGTAITVQVSTSEYGVIVTNNQTSSAISIYVNSMAPI